MAEKKISIFVEAVIAGAKRKLREVEGAVRNLGRTTSTAAGTVSDATVLMQGAIKAMAVAVTAKLSQMSVQWVVQSARMAAVNADLEASFQRLAAQSGMASTAIIAALKKASKGTVDEFSLMLGANKAMRLGVAATTDEFEDLMKIAMVRAKEFGITTQRAWDTIINAIGRASPMIADNLGIILDADAAYEKYARSIGKSADDLSKLEEKQALLNAVLEAGAGDIEAWAESGDTAAESFARFDAAVVDLKVSLGELTVGPLADLAELLSIELPKAVQSMMWEFDAMKASYAEWFEAMRTGDWRAVIAGPSDATYRMEILNQKWGEFYQESIRGREEAQAAGDAIRDTGQDVDDLSDALEKGQDIWADYGRRAAEASYKFARRVEDTQFRATQAAENAAFRRFEIERNAADRRSDLLNQYNIRLEAATVLHNNRLKYMKQDLLDNLADMEWDYQQKVNKLMRQAPWWVRNALQKEFKEREQIVKSGDKEALKAFDENLKEKIRAIDPAYAEELDLLLEHHQHQTEVEKREARQGQQRQQADWQIRLREQRQSLDQQLYELGRNLDNQLVAWEFHQGQREEAERRSMIRMEQDHSHAMSVLYENTQRKLAEITPLWEHYGNEWGTALIRGIASGQGAGTPQAPGYDPSYGPYDQLPNVYGGAAPAAATGAGTTVNIDVNVGGGYTPYQAQEIADTLGQSIRKQLR